MKQQCVCRCTFQRDCLIELSCPCVVSGLSERVSTLADL
nr:DUF3709 domain-containing protein [Vibrio mimicus]